MSCAFATALFTIGLGGSPSAFETIITDATEKWAKVIKAAGIRAE